MNLLLKQLFFITVIFVFVRQATAQDRNSFNKKLLDVVFAPFQFHPIPERNILYLKNRSTIAKFNPLLYVSAGMLFFYQRIVSEQIQAECTYEISCSDYTKFSIERHGFKGFLSGINQWNNCFPSVIFDYPEYKVSKNLKINNHNDWQ